MTEEVLGDLEEKYYQTIKRKSITKAKWNYWYQTLNYLRPFALKNNRITHLIQHIMYSNYFKIAFRTLSRNKVFAFIHILGLTIGTAACLLIMQYVYFEKSYDTFHENAENIYRVPIEYSKGFGAFPKTAATHPALGPAMKADFPEVEDFARLFHPANMGMKLAFSYTGKPGQRVSAAEDKIYFADSSFFNIFSFPFKLGDPKTALSAPNTVVLSATMAKKYFGNENPIGKTINANGRAELTVSGVFEDIPDNSHINFNGLISFHTFFGRPFGPTSAWLWPEFYTYVLLKPESNPKAIAARFPKFTKKYMASIHKEHNFQTYFSLQPLLDIHLKSECANEIVATGSERTVSFLSLLALFILIIAWVNYINLSTSKAIERAKEVGVRKVVGAEKKQLIGQFLVEATLLNGVSIILGVLLANIFLPQFAQLTGKNIGNALLNSQLLSQPIFWLILLGVTLLGGLLSGFYPAIVLSAFRPVQVLKGYLHKSKQTVSLRKALVSFQFILSIVLIAGTLLITNQLSFMANKELGYEKDQVLVIKSPLITDSTTTLKTTALKTELLQYPAITSFTKSTEVPGKLIALRSESRKEGLDKEANISMHLKSIDDQFLSTFNIPLVAGRNFTETERSNPFDSDNTKILLNEILATRLGFRNPEDALGKSILFKLGPEDRKAQVIGVVKNYHQRSLKEDYDPILYLHPSYDPWKYYSLNIQTEDWGETIAMIEKKYEATFAGNSFEYFFLDDFFDRQYRAEQQFGKVCQLIAALAIFVACLGFFGLSTLLLAQRRKEIGIRKILGASPQRILLLVSKDFIYMLLMANVIAVPIIFYFGRQWLNNFAFNTGLSWPIFVLPILFLLSIVFVIVGIQMYRTAILNPIISLRNE